MMSLADFSDTSQGICIPDFAGRIVRITENQKSTLWITTLLFQISKIYMIGAILPVVGQNALHNISTVVENGIEDALTMGNTTNANSATNVN